MQKFAKFKIPRPVVDTAFGYFFVSACKSVMSVTLCVLINLIGIITAEVTNNLLLLDFAGTIAIAIIYGPIHASLVGLISSYIGQVYLVDFMPIFSNRFEDYFIFAPVHAVIGMVVFFAPRVLDKPLKIDIFRNNYSAGRLLVSIVFLSLLTNFASSVMHAAIMSIDSLQMTCDFISEKKKDVSAQWLCGFTKLVFREGDSEIEYQFLKFTISKFMLNFPDHLICFSSAVVIVAFVLDARRYKMSGEFARTIITNHPAVGLVYFFFLLFFIYIYASYVYDYANSDMFAAFMVWSFYNAFIAFIAFMVVDGRFDVWWFKPNHKVRLEEFIYDKFNRNMKDAYEDSMKFAILYSVAIYFIAGVSELEPNDQIYDLFQGKLVGALGVVGVTSFIRYLVLIVARIVRYWRREFWHVQGQAPS